ncbi:MAG: hypothetical protein FGM15_11835 [Chthoniobacterales bacterium]|nr:hypothetical protein [Chthoniobacterales bacterium]
MDAPRAVGAGFADLATTDWLADSAPVYLLNLGPEIAGTLFGCELEFGPATSWSRIILPMGTCQPNSDPNNSVGHASIGWR